MPASPSSPIESISSSPLDVSNPPPDIHLTRSYTTDVVEQHRVDSGFRSLKSYARRHRKPTHSFPLHDQGIVKEERPYFEYVRQLVASGWINLSDLADYLGTPTRSSDPQGEDLVVSVLDISDELQLRQWPEIYSPVDLRDFMDRERKTENARIRYYIAEYEESPTVALIETLGTRLKLDPRFWQWSIHSKGHVFTPSQRHRAPFVSLEFGVLDSRTENKTDAERFRVLIYIQPDEDGKGWTGVILFSTHTRISMCPRILHDPPAFKSDLPPSISLNTKSFREIYLESLSLFQPSSIIASPFYGISALLRMNCFFWNEIISTIKEEDKRLGGISDTSIGHAEEIKKSLHVVQRGGSFGWKGRDEEKAKESQVALEEDFKHLVEQTEILWQNRERMAAIRQRNSDTRWTSLTNAFTYIFAPVTIISGIYGMNVSQISGSTSNPNIWQFFVAVAVFNVAVVLALSVSNWMHIQWKHGRAAGLKEVLGFAVGRIGNQGNP